MSWTSLTSIHTVTVHPLTETDDGALGTTVAPGAATATLKCRVVPLDERERAAYGASGIAATHKVFFHGDPSLTAAKAVKYDGNYYRVKLIQNVGELNKHWAAIVNREPEVALA